LLSIWDRVAVKGFSSEWLPIPAFSHYGSNGKQRVACSGLSLAGVDRWPLEAVSRCERGGVR
jgi:hypothetical protein